MVDIALVNVIETLWASALTRNRNEPGLYGVLQFRKLVHCRNFKLQNVVFNWIQTLRVSLTICCSVKFVAWKVFEQRIPLLRTSIYYFRQTIQYN